MELTGPSRREKGRVKMVVKVSGPDSTVPKWVVVLLKFNQINSEKKILRRNAAVIFILLFIRS